MAGSRPSAAVIDQWRPEDQTLDRVKGGRNLSLERHRSPDPGRRPRDRHRAARDSGKADVDVAHSSAKHSRVRSRERKRSRSRERRRARVRSRSPSPERAERSTVHRPSRARLPSEDRTSYHRRHGHDSPSSAKRRRSISPSPSRDFHRKRSRRGKGYSPDRSPSPSRIRSAENSHRHSKQEFSSRPSRTERVPPRGSSPAPYFPPPRRRSPSAETHHKASTGKHRRRSRTPDRQYTSRHESSPPRRSSPSLYTHRNKSPHSADKHKRYRDTGGESQSRRDKERNDRSYKRSFRSPSPLPEHRSGSPSRPRSRTRKRGSEAEARHHRSQRSPSRRRSRSPNAVAKSSDHRKDSLKRGAAELGRGKSEISRKRGESAGYDSESRRSFHEDDKMRGGTRPHRPYQDTRNYSHSPPYMTPHQMSPHTQPMYNNGRGGWAAPHYGSNQGYVSCLINLDAFSHNPGLRFTATRRINLHINTAIIRIRPLKAPIIRVPNTVRSPLKCSRDIPPNSIVAVMEGTGGINTTAPNAGIPALLLRSRTRRPRLSHEGVVVTLAICHGPLPPATGADAHRSTSHAA